MLSGLESVVELDPYLSRATDILGLFIMDLTNMKGNNSRIHRYNLQIIRTLEVGNFPMPDYCYHISTNWTNTYTGKNVTLDNLAFGQESKKLVGLMSYLPAVAEIMVNTALNNSEKVSMM